MKVEPFNDVQPILSPDQPRIGVTQTQAGATAIDDIAQIFNEEMALNGVALGRRSIGRQVTPIEHITQLYEQLGHPAQASLATVARQVRMQLLLQPGIDTLLELTGRDPARTFVVLQRVAAEAQAEARKVEAALARDALAKLEIRFKREIQAGLNIALTLQQASGDPEERQAVRALYYASVVMRQSLAFMMQSLLGVYGGEQFGAGLNLMRRALADDIAAHTPSVPTAQLRTLLLGLQSCSQLGGALSNCQALIQRLDAELDAVGLLQRLLGYAGTGIESAEVQRLACDFGGALPAAQLVSLNGLYPVMQRLPLALWRDSRGREEALHNILLVMDEFTRAERGHLHFDGESRSLP
ncbi:YopN family type III secretion system gatekeeper subunit [Pseudomonas palleroniana]|uniref:Type III secretion protein W n=1 Tax=Pseudomonas palleroniana TaxID=191390 RepID=A0A1H5J044_9PSED|nr:type III secretion system gatekeeper subunit SctW [Pseudomonas palleroniana]KAB0566946.1 YopN family type III secretion system gatekeeper subunit [Pseudomonas palleroniana]PTC28284.1 YopN family type III secretion system gatekeeper subunit [Pseudomonas palleroniana]SEE45657.1 type III secretion protein W [Pseudomonas palleroniana]